MTTGHVFIATSLDGYIARIDGDVDWLMNYVVEGEDTGYEAMMESVDGMIMGKGTFQKVLTFGEWPYRKPVIVMSTSLVDTDIPKELAGKVQLSNKSPEALMLQLSCDGWKRAYVDGGKIIQSFLTMGLIEDLILTRVPILIGDGLPLFGPTTNDIELEHLKTVTFQSGLVSSKYRVAKGG